MLAVKPFNVMLPSPLPPQGEDGFVLPVELITGVVVTVIVIEFDVAGFPDGQAIFEVNTQVTVFPFANVLLV